MINSESPDKLVIDYADEDIPESGSEEAMYMLIAITGSVLLQLGIEYIEVDADVVKSLARVEIDTSDSNVMKISAKKMEKPHEEII